MDNGDLPRHRWHKLEFATQFCDTSKQAFDQDHQYSEIKEANTAAPDSEEPRTDWKGGGDRPSSIATPPSANMSSQNAGKVKFEPPKVPVIFVLGGPGSGKVTHCDTLMQEKKGITHINMMDLLQQYAIGNDMQDFSQLSSKTVTEVLMLEIKMAPAAKAYLISGYPRSMRDVVEYTEKIQVINGVILISWRQAVLQKQIDYGAKLGHVVLSLAKMELENFFKNVMPVADYFDQSDMLMAVNGERAPSEVYKDFRISVLDILGAQDNQEALLNGVAGMGNGMNEIPGSIVSVETAPSQPKPVVTATTGKSADTTNKYQQLHPNTFMGQNTSIAELPTPPLAATKYNAAKLPPIICIIGGPGSNKAMLCLKAISLIPGWGHFSIGRLVRTIAESDPKANTENHAVKEAITAGEMVPKKSIDKLIETQLMLLVNKKGILIDGYPRDIQQVKDFADKYHQKPPIVLLDCSKLQLGRGRMDDTISSFRRRLELFRELTLPMLKTLDNEGRLTIVDGDTDSPSVQKEFEKIIMKNTQQLVSEWDGSSGGRTGKTTTMSSINTGKLYQKDGRNGTNARGRPVENVVEDLESSPPGVVPTIAHHISLVNGHIGSGGGGGVGHRKKAVDNGHVVGNGKPSFRNLLDEAEDPVDSYM